MIIIGDIHGEYDKLMRLVDNLPQTDDLCFVGDLIDRGPDSKKVVDFVKNNGYNCVIGNHEVFLTNSLYIGLNNTHCFNNDVYDLWIYNGGKQTLKSFGDSIWEYLDWFNSLPFYIQHERYLITHSYAANSIYTDTDNLVWTRDFSRPINDNVINIFGHTIHRKPTQYHGRHWCIDTGAHHFGIITAFDTDTRSFYYNRNI